MGIATGVRATDGKKLWQKRIGGNYSASPTINGNLVFLQSENGEAIVLKIDEQPEELSRNQLPGRVFASMRLSTTTGLFGRKVVSIESVLDDAPTASPIKSMVHLYVRRTAGLSMLGRHPRRANALTQSIWTVAGRDSGQFDGTDPIGAANRYRLPRM